MAEVKWTKHHNEHWRDAVEHLCDARYVGVAEREWCIGEVLEEFDKPQDERPLGEVIDEIVHRIEAGRQGDGR